MYGLALHGGAGTIDRSLMSLEKEAKYHEALKVALNSGFSILQAAGTALDAVEATVVALEDDDLFNAGRGSVFTADETHEMDASIMCGKSLQAGAVCAIQNVKNPVRLTRAILNKGSNVFLTGKGAEKFAREAGLPFEENAYFFSESRYQQLREAKKKSVVQLDHSGGRYGTVGAVAVDMNGNLAAATSTGGLTNKDYGRIGDTAIIGAGTYANNATCAVSCTGVGEYFIRSVVAYDVSCLMEYKGLSLEEACQFVIHKKLSASGGEGGLIAVDASGNFQLVFNSAGMYRGWRKESEREHIEIFR